MTKEGNLELIEGAFESDNEGEDNNVVDALSP